MKHGVCSCTFCVAALITSARIILSNLTTLMPTFSAGVSIFPFDFCQIFLAVKFSLEAFTELYDSLTFKYIYFERLKSYKYMQLKGHLYKKDKF